MHISKSSFQTHLPITCSQIMICSSFLLSPFKKALVCQQVKRTDKQTSGDAKTRKKYC